MAIDCTQLQTDYDELCAAIRVRMRGKAVVRSKYGEKEVEYGQVSLSQMITERDRMANQLKTACNIDVSGAGPRITAPVFARTY